MNQQQTTTETITQPTLELLKAWYQSLPDTYRLPIGLRSNTCPVSTWAKTIGGWQHPVTTSSAIWEDTNYPDLPDEFSLPEDLQLVVEMFDFLTITYSNNLHNNTSTKKHIGLALEYASYVSTHGFINRRDYCVKFNIPHRSY